MNELGPISGYLPYLWGAFILSSGTIVGFYVWLIYDLLTLSRQKKTLDQ